MPTKIQKKLGVSIKISENVRQPSYSHLKINYLNIGSIFLLFFLRDGVMMFIHNTWIFGPLFRYP
jgi:hypothetical protein